MIYCSVIEVASLQYGANVLEQLAQSVKEGMCDTLQKQISVDSVYSADERNKLLLPAECVSFPSSFYFIQAFLFYEFSASNLILLRLNQLRFAAK